MTDSERNQSLARPMRFGASPDDAPTVTRRPKGPRHAKLASNAAPPTDSSARSAPRWETAALWAHPPRRGRVRNHFAAALRCNP